MVVTWQNERFKEVNTSAMDYVFVRHPTFPNSLKWTHIIFSHWFLECFVKFWKSWVTQNFSPAAFCTKEEWRKQRSRLCNRGEMSSSWFSYGVTSLRNTSQCEPVVIQNSPVITRVRLLVKAPTYVRRYRSTKNWEKEQKSSVDLCYNARSGSCFQLLVYTTHYIKMDYSCFFKEEPATFGRTQSFFIT